MGQGREKRAETGCFVRAFLAGFCGVWAVGSESVNGKWPENAVGTSKNGMPGFGRKKTGFLEKCENGCKMSERGKGLAG